MAFAQETSVSSENVLSECQVTVPSQECQTKVSYKSVK